MEIFAIILIQILITLIQVILIVLLAKYMLFKLLVLIVIIIVVAMEDIVKEGKIMLLAVLFIKVQYGEGIMDVQLFYGIRFVYADVK